MLAAGVIRIAEATIAVAVIDSVLAPDLPLADMNALFGGEEPLILCIHKTGNDALRTIPSADHGGHHPQSRMDGVADVLARVVHRREVAAGNKGDLIAVAIVEGRQQLSGLLVLLARVVECEPTDGPGHFAIRAASGEGISPRADTGGTVVRRLIEANGAVGSDLNLVDSYD